MRDRRRSSGTRPPCPRPRRRASGARAGRRPRPRGRRSGPRASSAALRWTARRSSTTSVRYAASWISACLKRYSGSGHRRPSRSRSSRCSVDERRTDVVVPGSPPRAAAARTAARGRRPPSGRCAAAGRAGRSARGSTFSTVGGISTSTVVIEAPTVARRATSAPASTSERTSSSRKNGLPSACSSIRSSMSSGKRAGADERVEQLETRVARQRLERDLARPVRQLARGVLLHAPRRVVALRSAA